MSDKLARVEALYAAWDKAVPAVDHRTQNGLGYQEAFREATVALGAALGHVDIENPIAPGEESA